MTTLTAARVHTPAGLIGPAAVTFEGDRITAVEAVASGPNVTIAAGFIDLQVNGVDDVNVATASDDQWDRLDGLIAAQGVTTWCPTVVTAPQEAIDRAIAAVARAMSRPSASRPDIAGVHVEGPFLGGAPGAHPPEWLRGIDAEWLGRLPRHVRIVTLAPELDGALDVIRSMCERGTTVSLGHSAADYETVAAAVDAGASMVTHLFNGMTPLHHRAPGLVGFALAEPVVVAGLIADNVHVHPALLRVAFAAKSAAAVALVTDAVAWRAAHIGNIEIELVSGVPRLPDGTLAGSALTMDGAVANVVRAGVRLEDALVAASATPASVLGLVDRGHLTPGYRADLVVLDADLRAVATWVGGQQVAGR